MTTTQSLARNEFDILESLVPDAAILPFKKEILALCEAFGRSGQSGGSAPYTAGAIVDSLKKLLLQDPICEITGGEKEWADVSYIPGETLLQNKRCSGLFKYDNGRCSYVSAIVWKGIEDWDTFTGRVYVDDNSFELIGSSQCVVFPFKPKTFYVDVVRVPINEDEAISRNLDYIKCHDEKCYYTIIKDPKQLSEVFQYYNKI